MTAKQLFEYSLIELNKIQAPSLILEDYNYFINKAINQYINKVYNLYDVNQQKTDDLRVLKSTAILTPSINTDYTNMALLMKTYEADLPDDYLHLLNCVLEYKVNQTFKCYNKDDQVHFGAKRLTADMFSQIINNYYMRPTYKTPYFYINNVATDLNFPISQGGVSVTGGPIQLVNTAVITVEGTPEASTLVVVKDNKTITFTYNASPTTNLQFSTRDNLLSALNANGITSDKGYDVVGDPDLTTIEIKNPYQQGISSVTTDATPSYVEVVTTFKEEPLVNALTERIENLRYGNRSKVRLEIRYGKDNVLFELQKVYVDYLKAPQFIRLTQEQVDEVVDNSQILEFPDYVNQEIVNELIKLLMENASDPRLQTTIPINQSIANPAQEQQQSQKR